MSKTVKELSELIQAICKIEQIEKYPSSVRKTKEAVITDLIGEMADAQIMLWQLQYLLKINDRDLLEAMDGKISRTEENLKQ